MRTVPDSTICVDCRQDDDGESIAQEFEATWELQPCEVFEYTCHRCKRRLRWWWFFLGKVRV